MSPDPFLAGVVGSGTRLACMETCLFKLLYSINYRLENGIDTILNYVMVVDCIQQMNAFQ